MSNKKKRKKRVLSDEERERRRLQLKAYWADPANREKQSRKIAEYRRNLSKEKKIELSRKLSKAAVAREAKKTVVDKLIENRNKSLGKKRWYRTPAGIEDRLHRSYILTNNPIHQHKKCFQKECTEGVVEPEKRGGRRKVAKKVVRKRINTYSGRVTESEMESL